MKVAVVLGTRPEAIKLGPLILRLRQAAGVETLVVNSGQHREMAIQALAAFDIAPDITLATMAHGQSLGRLTGRLFTELDELFEILEPDWVIVQGDTTTAMTAATTAFYRKIKVGHVEAGLRTFDRWAPFPEEVNRSYVGQVADLHFAPTAGARANLLKAGVDDAAITVTGNTVVDAVELLRPRLTDRPLSASLDAGTLALLEGRRLILVTSHRRESFGEGLQNICEALLDLAARFPDVLIVYPVHLNPNVQAPVRERLGSADRIVLLEPLDYLDLMALVERSTLVLTDSGGLQEEVPSFGKPILVLREVTERPEVVEVGAARLVGTDRETIVSQATQLLTDPVLYASMASVGNPFGDGRASERIVARLQDDG
jgi:UDP-N-acetylglucosamine 2-epimerase (non-hydrolysing)